MRDAQESDAVLKDGHELMEHFFFYEVTITLGTNLSILLFQAYKPPVDSSCNSSSTKVLFFL